MVDKYNNYLTEIQIRMVSKEKSRLQNKLAWTNRKRFPDAVKRLEEEIEQKDREIERLMGLLT